MAVLMTMPSRRSVTPVVVGVGSDEAVVVGAEAVVDEAVVAVVAVVWLAVVVTVGADDGVVVVAVVVAEVDAAVDVIGCSRPQPEMTMASATIRSRPANRRAPVFLYDEGLVLSMGRSHPSHVRCPPGLTGKPDWNRAVMRCGSFSDRPNIAYNKGQT